MKAVTDASCNKNNEKSYFSFKLIDMELKPISQIRVQARAGAPKNKLRRRDGAWETLNCDRGGDYNVDFGGNGEGDILMMMSKKGY